MEGVVSITIDVVVSEHVRLQMRSQRRQIGHRVEIVQIERCVGGSLPAIESVCIARNIGRVSMRRASECCAGQSTLFIAWHAIVRAAHIGIIQWWSICRRPPVVAFRFGDLGSAVRRVVEVPTGVVICRPQVIIQEIEVEVKAISGVVYRPEIFLVWLRDWRLSPLDIIVVSYIVSRFHKRASGLTIAIGSQRLQHCAAVTSIGVVGVLCDRAVKRWGDERAVTSSRARYGSFPILKM